MVAPKLRFKEFDGNWNLLTFSDVFKFYNTNSYSRALLEENGEIMNIHYGDIHTKFSMLFDVEKEKAPYLSKEIESHKINEDNFLKVGDLVIADASEDYKDIGKTIEIINLNNKKVVAGLHTYIARPLKPFALGFNGYLMQTHTIRTQIQKLATGISVLGISKTNISKVELYLPSPEEQTKIASFLSAVDEKISQLSQKHQLLSQYKQGMMQKLFSQQIRFKADDGSEFGEWEERKLSDICLKIKDGTHFSPKTLEVGDYKYLTSKNVKNGYLDFSNLEFVNAEDHKKIYSSCDVKFGDVLLTKDGTIGQCCVNTLTEEFSLLSSVAFLRLKTQFNNYFLYHLLVSDFGQREINGVIAGQALKRITLTKINDFKFMFPCFEEQTKIANFLSAIDQKIDVVKEQLEQAKLWKKGLLQQMFV